MGALVFFVSFLIPQSEKCTCYLNHNSLGSAFLVRIKFLPLPSKIANISRVFSVYILNYGIPITFPGPEDFLMCTGCSSRTPLFSDYSAKRYIKATCICSQKKMIHTVLYFDTEGQFWDCGL